MRTSTLKQICTHWVHEIRFPLVIRLLGIVLACSPTLFGQYAQIYVNEYVDVSVGSDGTLYASAITDAQNMQVHTADAYVEIYSPNAREASASTSAGYGGYARADSSLAFDPNDVGNYSITAYGDGYCPVSNTSADASNSVDIFGFGIHELAYVLQSMNSDFTLGNYTRCNAGTDCTNATVPASFFGGFLPQHCTIKWITYTNSVGQICVGVSGAIRTECVPDPIP